jgi:hypothetical protein
MKKEIKDALEELAFREIEVEIETHVEKELEDKENSKKDFPNVLVYHSKRKEEFGIETDLVSQSLDKDKVLINAGGTSILIDRKEYLRAHFNWIMRDSITKSLKV